MNMEIWAYKDKNGNRWASVFCSTDKNLKMSILNVFNVKSCDFDTEEIEKIQT